MVTKELIDSKLKAGIPLTKGEKIACSNIKRTAHIHKNKDKEILFIVQKDRNKFLDIIRPYVCGFMKCKFGDYADTITEKEYQALEAELFGH